ncbi:MAG: UvrD-helicase domain-containing protein [Eubacterium sp.]|nr:UvrD-helicase domain-containing protein [Eubacterium sp.]
MDSKVKKNKPNWTSEQREVISSRDQELLVSAAAGSGKTAVLVERIYSRLIDKDNPVDVDRFVVVTFTKSAAAEMKDRLRERIEEALADEETTPEQKRILRRQARLIPGAHISTVHSFCNYIIGQYFYRIGLDPACKEAEETDLKLLKNEVLDALLEREYEAGEEDFDRLASLRSLNKNDAALKTWILDMYAHAFCEPFPDLTMAEWEKQISLPLDDEDSVYLPALIRYVTSQAEEIEVSTKQIWDRYAAGFTKKNDAKTPTEIIGAAHSLVTIGTSFAAGERDAAKAYEDMRLVLAGMDLKGLPQKATKKEGSEMRDLAIEAIIPIREKMEKTFREKYFGNTLKEHERERQAMAETTLAVIRLTKAFAEDYAAAKREREIIDFNDLEQFALQILYDKDEESGERTRSEVARELSEYFCEVMIDEYQDSNRVQDTILWSITKSDDSEESGKPPWECTGKNRFMVGDIKQSIYRFRHACPELFRQKMEFFSHDKKAPCRRIDLHKNFRSREIIIDSTNAVFDRVMKKDIGGVEYDADARLALGLNVPEPGEGQPVPTVVYEDRIPYRSGWGSQEKNNAEAYHIACRIRDMVIGNNPLYIADKNGEYHRVRYRDIVILSRAVSGCAYTYAKVFEREDIPFVTELSKGFYDARETSLMIQLLQIIDNPRQDIPLAGVLASPLFGMGEERLSEVRIAHPQGELIDALRSYEEEKRGTDSKTAACLTHFFEVLDALRAEAPYVTLSTLVEDIFEKTGIYEMFKWDEDGERRLANLDYFLHIVMQFEKGSRHGVHAFVEHLSDVLENEIDSGEAGSIGENEDAVRLMSIHKSKGLEFPVVFLTRAGSKPKGADVDRFVYDADLGVGGYMDDMENGWTKPTLIWNLIHNKNVEDEQGEAFRLLYVAMTRARDQLILVHAEKDEVKPRSTDYEGRMRMLTPMDMIRPAILADPGEKLFCLREITGDLHEYWSEIEKTWRNTLNSSSRRENIFDTSETYNTDIKGVLEEKSAGAPPVRMSVSELKLASMEMWEEQTGTRLELAEGKAAGAGNTSADDAGGVTPEDLPSFMKETRHTYTGAERGTIYHQVMATIDFAGLAEMLSADGSGDGATGAADETVWTDAVERALDRVITDKHLRSEERSVIDSGRLVTFFRSELGQRMIRAAGAGKLKREQPFVIHKKASEIDAKKYAHYPDTPVMIQGIIDGYFEEEDGIVLMDYKTDTIPSDKPYMLTERYRVQMKLYREALERLLDGKQVKECFLYSFHLGKSIPMSL